MKTQTLKELFNYLKGKREDLDKLFVNDIVFDSPQVGRVVGITAVKGVFSEFKANIEKCASGLVVDKILNGRNFVAAEAHLNLIEKEFPALPIAVAADFEENRITNLRIYHSNFAIKGKHEIRKALFADNRLVKVSHLVELYHQALSEGNVGAALKLFSEDAVAREPSGGEFGEGKPMGLRNFFAHAFRSGGVKLHYHTFAEEDGSIAAEYTCYHWGEKQIPPQAGMEFWELGSDNQFKAVRIYDDVEQPGR